MASLYETDFHAWTLARSARRTVTRAALVAFFALAACGSPPPRAPVAGQQARAGVDAATKAYSDCVDRRAGIVPVASDLAGPIVAGVIRDCRPVRLALLAKVAAFHKLGHPAERQDYADLVAEESVKDVDGPIAAAAVIKIVERQQAAGKTGK